MKKAKTVFIAAGALVLLGCIIFGGAMMALGWNFTSLSTAKYETNEHEMTGEFTEIAVSTETAKIMIVPSEDGKCRVVCRERINARHSVTVADGKLTVSMVDGRKWYERIFDFGLDTVTVCLPEAAYASLAVENATGDVTLADGFTFGTAEIKTSTAHTVCYANVTDRLKIHASTGSISVENVTVGALDLSVSTGSVTVASVTCAGDANIRVSTGGTHLSSFTCKNLITEGSTGNILLWDVTADGKFSIERSTGYIRFEGCDAAEISVKTSTGDVTGRLLSAKIFDAKSDTGKVDVPDTKEGGPCKIRTGTGKIRITLSAEPTEEA